MLSTETADLASASQLALYPLLVFATGALVKWWMRGLVKSLESISKTVERLVEKDSTKERMLGVLEERIANQARRIEGLERSSERRKP